VATFDYFVGNLRCPKCGSVSKEDSSTNMQTKLSMHPQLGELAVGDRVNADWGHVGGAGYLCINPPLVNDSVLLLESWECPMCDKAFNWARICIEYSVIRAIEDVDLTTAVVQSANYISEECRYLLSEESVASSESIVRSLLNYLRGRTSD